MRVGLAVWGRRMDRRESRGVRARPNSGCPRGSGCPCGRGAHAAPDARARAEGRFFRISGVRASPHVHPSRFPDSNAHPAATCDQAFCCTFPAFLFKGGRIGVQKTPPRRSASSTNPGFAEASSGYTDCRDEGQTTPSPGKGIRCRTDAQPSPPSAPQSSPPLRSLRSFSRCSEAPRLSPPRQPPKRQTTRRWSARRRAPPPPPTPSPTPTSSSRSKSPQRGRSRPTPRTA